MMGPERTNTRRRAILSALGVIPVALTGCLSGGSVVASGTTTGPKTWFVELKAGQPYEFVVELLEGHIAAGAVDKQTDSGPEAIVTIEVVDDDRKTKEFQIEETREYSVSIGTDGRASWTIRRV